MDVTELFKDLKQLNIKDIQVDMSIDKMSATVCLGPIADEEKYTYDEVMDKLSEADVKMGVDERKILEIIDQKVYGQSIIVASGVPQQPGDDGYYEFFFDVDYRRNNKPKIRTDGSVDYFNTKLFEKVNEGDKLAEYHQPTKGVFGFDVSGKLLIPKPGKPKSKLRGKGFTLLDDGNTYISNMTGRVDYLNYDMTVSKIFDIQGDVDLTIGNVDFDGDVNITGGVATGVLIHAMGNIYIGGHVEGANIISDKDIIFNDGVNAKGIGRIMAKGNISGKYFENANVFADSDIKCGYILNSRVVSRGKVIVEGRRGSIMGGDVTGVMGIETYNCGNSSETKTVVRVGATRDIRQEYADSIMKRKDIDTIIEVFETALKKYDAAKKIAPDSVDKAAYTKIFQSKIIKTAERNKVDSICKELLELIKESSRALIKVEKNLYTGCKLFLDDKVYLPEDVFAHLIVKIYNDTVVVESYDDE